MYIKCLTQYPEDNVVISFSFLIYAFVNLQSVYTSIATNRIYIEIGLFIFTIIEDSLFLYYVWEVSAMRVLSLLCMHDVYFGCLYCACVISLLYLFCAQLWPLC